MKMKLFPDYVEKLLILPNVLLFEEGVTAAALNTAGEQEILIVGVEYMWAPGIIETSIVCVEKPWVAGVKEP